MFTQARLPLAICLFALLSVFSSPVFAQPVFGQVDTSTPAGRWYMNSLSTRMIFRFELVNGAWRGASIDDQGKTLERLENIVWDKKTRALEFTRIGSGYWQWYRGTIVEGVFVGRYAHSGKTAVKPTAPLEYKWKATGWNFEYLTPTSRVPAVFDITVNETGFQARFRLDKSPTKPNKYEGRLKFYGYNNACSEGLEIDAIVEQWDGTNLKFQAFDANIYAKISMTFTGVVSGRNLQGTLKQTNPGQVYNHTFKGTRAEVLSYGFTGKNAQERENWQTRTRRQLEHLMMAGNPAPLKQEVRILRDNLPPMLGLPYATRDDEFNRFPQNYRLTELALRHTLANPFGGAPLIRETRGYLAKPTTRPTGAVRGVNRYPLVIAINGHGGSAFQTFDPNSLFWYGDGFARQGYMVLAINISHRPTADLVFSGGHIHSESLGYFNDAYARGDDPARGNVAQPSIKPALPAGTFNPELYTDFEEDGERLWDLRRAIDYALTRPDVDPTRITVVGLSLGGELSAYLGALDPRVDITIASGFSPDFSVLKYQGSHGCWLWGYADIREYIDSSDIFSLIAPRPLIVETGKQDFLYHCYPDHYISDKSIARRVRPAYAEAQDRFIHYLHSDYHIFRVGGAHATLPDRWVQIPSFLTPIQPGDQTWQVNRATYAPRQWTVYDYVRNWLSFRTIG